jgi:uncharacterized protein Yka (UPF0111/DUF47 family)
MRERVYTVAYYRKQAEEARQSAAMATAEEKRQGYLNLATSWDKLADDMETAASKALAGLTRSTPKAQ